MSRTSVNKVSIRLASGGHSCSIYGEPKPMTLDAVLKQCAGSSVEIVVDSHKCALVPKEMFSADNCARHLADMAIRVASTECVVCSEPVDGIVAVMAADSVAVESIKSAATAVRFTSPLLMGKSLERGTYLHLSEGVLYIRVYDATLRFAEAAEATTDSDILFLLESLHRIYGIYNMNACARGDVERLKRVTKGLFRTIEFEA